MHSANATYVDDEPDSQVQQVNKMSNVSQCLDCHVLCHRTQHITALHHEGRVHPMLNQSRSHSIQDL